MPFPANEIQEPYKQPLVTYGWAAPDAAYAMGRYDLADDQALIIEGTFAGAARSGTSACGTRSCRPSTTATSAAPSTARQVRYEPDGSWRLVIAAQDTGHPNWLSTAGHPRGVLWFRWFLADDVPAAADHPCRSPGADPGRGPSKVS